MSFGLAFVNTMLMVYDDPLMTTNGRVPSDDLPSEETIASRLQELEHEIARLIELRDGWKMIQRGRQQVLRAVPPSPKAKAKTTTETRTTTATTRALDALLTIAGTINAGPLSDTILAVMARDPRRDWTVGDIFDDLLAVGWKSSSQNRRNVVGVMLSRMAERGDIERGEGKGVYRLPADADARPKLPLTTEEDG